MYKAVFLDRDGVMNEVLSKRVKFVNKPEDFYLFDGVGEAIKKLNELNFKVFVVTNQGGVGLGYIDETTLDRIHHKMEEDLALYGAKIDDIAYCPHKPKAGCKCRKPEPEMLFQLADKYDIDLSNSFMVGDRKQDIDAGMKAGTITVLVGTRHEKVNADYTFKNLFAFVKWLENEERAFT